MGSGGGSTSGTVSYPTYLSNIQTTFLIGYGVESYDVTKPLMDVLNDSVGSSPWTGETAFDPDTRLTAIETEISSFEDMVDDLSETTGWAGVLAQAVTTLDANWTAPTPAAEDEIAMDVLAFEGIQDDRVETTVLPRFQRGMQDINAVMSSAFVIGEAIIEGMTNRDVAKYQGELRTKAFLLKDQLVADSLLKKNIAYTISAEQMIRYVGLKLGANEALTRIRIDGQKIGIIAQKEESDQQLDIDVADASWDIERFQYAANLIGSIAGGTALPGTAAKPSKTASVIGGAASGAAMGATAGAGNPYATGAGAVVGAYLAYSQY